MILKSKSNCLGGNNVALVQLHFYSNALGMQTEVGVILPQKNTTGEIGVENHTGNAQYKCLYLLHGLSDDQTIWMRRTSIERYATRYGICVIMPFGGRSFYLNQQNGEKYYTYIAEELPARMQEFFGCSNKRENNFIAGISMGGYGALKVALKEEGKFCAAAGLSSVADIKTKRFQAHIEGLVGNGNYLSESEDLFMLIKAKNELPQKPKLYMWCGTEDFLYQDNVRLKEYIPQFDYDYTYRESEGAHCWESWDEQIQHVLRWMFEK